jgi:activator of 2-hydroxyglutaryl-CoA dehydratase
MDERKAKETLFEADLFIKAAVTIIVPLVTSFLIAAGVTVYNTANEQIRQADAIDRIREGMLLNRQTTEQRFKDYEDRMKDINTRQTIVEKDMAVLRMTKQ